MSRRRSQLTLSFSWIFYKFNQKSILWNIHEQTVSVNRDTKYEDIWNRNSNIKPTTCVNCNCFTVDISFNDTFNSTSSKLFCTVLTLQSFNVSLWFRLFSFIAMVQACEPVWKRFTNSCRNCKSLDEAIDKAPFRKYLKTSSFTIMFDAFFCINKHTYHIFAESFYIHFDVHGRWVRLGARRLANVYYIFIYIYE